ncbi:HNH endonuclease signature motif containing protein [Microbacterium sp. H1-D42]|uniref:HNH endonuclease signature motif containing protein n=1 Tax=Microbacterium sp. H1-D42 TaxID=2925844 RepID=UPI001F53C864|nr:HNH endonuclease signature motif containing protein [Microbacterium sp. H1-D42]UNK71875.1 HNH endonuclease [Microbacterium sp. H1-D42]
MKSTAALLDRVVADLDQVLSADEFTGLSDTERLQLLSVAGDALRRVEAVIVETVATSESVDLPHNAGCRNMNDLLQRTLRVDARTAGQLVKAGKAVHRETVLTSGAPLPARWPALRQAMLDGAIGVTGLLAATGPVESAGDRIGAADRWKADAVLAEVVRGYTATEGADADGGDTDADDGADADDAAQRDRVPPATPEDVKAIAHAIALRLDPDGAEPTEQRAMTRRFLSIGRMQDGVYPLRGNLLPETYAQLQLLLDAQLNPKTDGPPVPEGVTFRPSDEEDDHRADDADDDGDNAGDGDPFNTDPRSVLDTRTRGQKQHDALAAALGIAARHADMPSLGGAAPTLVVHLDSADSSWATIPGVEAPVHAAAARHTGCTGAIQRVFTEQGRIVGITVTDRIFTVHQRRAITLRDRECLIPGCHVPATWCEIHHVTEHARGGPTSTDNGVPLCWWHHRSLDYSGWEIRMNHGLPEIRGPAWWDPEHHWRTPRLSLPDFAFT